MARPSTTPQDDDSRHDIWRRALRSRDPRFDGRFFVAVRTTGIYCRPVCPAVTPLEKNIRFFATAAGARQAGFRPCLRCRPEAAPGTPAWSGTGATVSRALRLIADGFLDHAGGAALGDRLGVGPRHLNRLFRNTLGTTPAAVARTRRLDFATRLVRETDLRMSAIAFAAGYRSLRRFNAVFRQSHGRPPSAMRRRAGATGTTGDGMVLTLAFRPPYAWPAILRFLAARAIPGIEAVDGDSYRRSIEIDHMAGTIALRPGADGRHLSLRVEIADPRHLARVVAVTRRLFDLDAVPDDIAEHLGRDPLLAPMVAAAPGLRLPGIWDGFEACVRAILGQQISLAGAVTLAARLVAAFGRQTPTHGTLFPDASALADADLAAIGLTRARVGAIRAVARAVASGALRLDRSVPTREVIAGLTALPGIGPWTAQYVAMRGLGDPDAFPATDLGLLKAFARATGQTDKRALGRRAEAWRPWRAHAALHLWQSLQPAPSK